MSEETIQNQPVVASREEVAFDDMKTREYISTKIGTVVEIEVVRIDKVAVESDFAFSMGKGKSAGFRYELISKDNRVLPVNVWKLWGAIRTACEEAGKNKDIKLKIEHPGEADYKVTVV